MLIPPQNNFLHPWPQLSASRQAHSVACLMFVKRTDERPHYITIRNANGMVVYRWKVLAILSYQNVEVLCCDRRYWARFRANGLAFLFRQTQWALTLHHFFGIASKFCITFCVSCRHPYGRIKTSCIFQTIRTWLLRHRSQQTVWRISTTWYWSTSCGRIWNLSFHCFVTCSRSK